MKVQYICDCCKKIFPTSDECKKHEAAQEFVSKAKIFQDSLFFWDVCKNPISLHDVICNKDNVRDIAFVQIESYDALAYLREIFHKYSYSSDGLDRPGLYGYQYLYLFDDWTNINTIYNEIKQDLKDLRGE